jgi:type I restriction enzyme R subunit
MRVADLQAILLDRVSELKMNLNPVSARIDAINQARSAQFWQSATVPTLETIRTELRGIMQYRQWVPRNDEPRITDIQEGEDGIVRGAHPGVSSANAMAVYTQRVLSVLRQLFAHDPILRKIRRAEPVTKSDLDTLVSLVLTQSPGVDLLTLKEFYPETAGGLADIIRKIVGMDPEVVDKRFATFAARYPLNAAQVHFLSMLKQEIALHGAIEIDRLYDSPFTAVHSEGLEGVFSQQQQAAELVTIVRSFEPQPVMKALDRI